MKRWTDEQLIAAVAKHTRMADVITELGYSSQYSSGYSRVKDRIVALNLDTSHWKRKRPGKVKKGKSLDDIFSGKDSYVGTWALRNRLIRDGLLKYECYLCGIKDWQGQKLSLQLDHIDGNRHNNQFANLRLLCPNCHSQTETFTGRNTRKGQEKYPAVVTSDSTQYACKGCDSTTKTAREMCVECRFKNGVFGMSKLTYLQVEELVKRYENGESSKDLAKEFGVVPHTIVNAINKFRARTGLPKVDNKIGHSVSPKGEQCGLSKITEEDVKTIRREWALGTSTEELANRFGVVSSNIVRIATYKAWVHVPQEPDVPLPSKRQSPGKLTEEKVRIIRQRRANDETCEVLAKEFGVSEETIRRTCLRKIWKNVA